MSNKTPERIEKLKVSDLIPYARNARTHSDEQVAQIAASIREFGWTNPVLIDAQGTIIAGHGRVMAARKLGLEVVPCIRLEHLTPAQARAYCLADNKLTLNAGWDDEMLKVAIEQSKEDGIDIALTGFSDEEIAQLFLEVQQGETDPVKEWEGMPEFDNPNNCFRKVIVNFEDEEAVKKFFETIGQDYTESTKSIWFPHKERRDLESIRWAESEEPNNGGNE